jgi:hypothetical protein
MAKTRMLGRPLVLAGIGACVVVTALFASDQRAGWAALQSGSASKERVEVSIEGRAQGSVVSIPRGLDCKPSCFARFPRGTEVTLVAGSGPSARFVSWKGECVGRAVVCSVVADHQVSVVAVFAPAPYEDVGNLTQSKYWLRVSVAPPRGGTVSSSPTGIDCPSRCESQFKRQTPVTLHAVASPGYSAMLTSLSANCRSDSCEVTMNAPVYIGATFRRRP